MKNNPKSVNRNVVPNLKRNWTQEEFQAALPHLKRARLALKAIQVAMTPEEKHEALCELKTAIAGWPPELAEKMERLIDEDPEEMLSIGSMVEALMGED